MLKRHDHEFIRLIAASTLGVGVLFAAMLIQSHQVGVMIIATSMLGLLSWLLILDSHEKEWLRSVVFDFGPKRYKSMKIFSICCIRDESDIIRETLESALEWSDKIFVFDNGSVDGTWDVINDIARVRREIVLIGHDDRVFTEELRGEIFEDNRGIASPDDWWCRLDADEIYIDSPALFLQKVPSRYGFVLSATFNFYFTDVDLRKYNEQPAHWMSLPVQQHSVSIKTTGARADLCATGKISGGRAGSGRQIAVECSQVEYGLSITSIALPNR